MVSARVRVRGWDLGSGEILAVTVPDYGYGMDPCPAYFLIRR